MGINLGSIFYLIIQTWNNISNGPLRFLDTPGRMQQHKFLTCGEQKKRSEDKRHNVRFK